MISSDTLYLIFFVIIMVWGLSCHLIYSIGEDRGRSDLLKEKRTELFNDIVKITIERRDGGHKTKQPPEVVFVDEGK